MHALPRYLWASALPLFEEQGEIDDVLSLELRGIGYSDPGGNKRLIHMSAGPSRFGVVVRDETDGMRVLLLQP